MAQSNVTDHEVQSQEVGRHGSETIPEWILARDGIKLIINDKGMEAQKLFLQYPDSLVMYAGYAFTLMMDALMSFEEDKLDKAIATLREVENRCTSEDGWLKAVKNRVFGESSSGTISKTYSEQLETQIILADSQVCIATLTFLQQDITGYLKGGWVLRKAWKIYQRLYKEILELYEENIGEFYLSTSTVNLMTHSELHSATTSKTWDIPEHLTNGYTRNSISHSKSAILNSAEISIPSTYNRKSNKSNVLSGTNLPKQMKKSFSVNTSLTNFTKNSNCRSTPFSNSFSLTSISSIFSIADITKEKNIEKDVIIRLMGAVCFGYGLFQLGVSLLPPSLIRLINLFGFSTNRENGLACLMYARLGSDMRSPLATLCLLWYHTIVRPFYAIDGTNVQAGAETALMLLEESEEEFGQSSLFLFYYGRAYRLKSEIQKSLTAFQQAIKRSNHRELKILCLHEVGWCHLIELQYCEAKDAFMSLKTSSRWSKAFYCYLSTVCIGACDLSLQSCQIDELKTVTNLMPKGMQLDEFLTKRLKRCLPSFAFAQQKKSIFWKLLIFEMLYLWNALPSCSIQNITKIISDCSDESDEPMIGLSKLISGSAYSVINEYEKSIANFRVCLDLRKNLPKNADDAHVSAFAQYELSALLLKNEQTRAEGRLLLQQMDHYSHFDFDQKLHVRVNSLLKHSA